MGKFFAFGLSHFVLRKLFRGSIPVNKTILFDSQRQGLGYHWELWVGLMCYRYHIYHGLLIWCSLTQMLAQCNLSNYEVLKAATYNGAKSLGMIGIGSIRPGIFLAVNNLYWLTCESSIWLLMLDHLRLPCRLAHLWRRLQSLEGHPAEQRHQIHYERRESLESRGYGKSDSTVNPLDGLVAWTNLIFVGRDMAQLSKEGWPSKSLRWYCFVFWVRGFENLIGTMISRSAAPQRTIHSPRAIVCWMKSLSFPQSGSNVFSGKEISWSKWY